ncbi:MAG: ATP-binding cassette domain-containing protein, partial [Ketobacter sp.]
MSTSIKAQNICIDFPVYENSNRSLKNTVFSMTTGGKLGNDGRSHPVVRAVDNLSFEFNEGARVGLTGHNGSGKTTLLRVLAGIYAPVTGSMEIHGRVASLLDVSMGLDPDATGFENIYLRGIVQGLSPAAIKEKMEDIAEFSELGQYLNLPVRTYSSGMLMRLAFSISTSVKADILIMDEWLSVGDRNFR